MRLFLLIFLGYFTLIRRAQRNFFSRLEASTGSILNLFPHEEQESSGSLRDSVEDRNIQRVVAILQSNIKQWSFIEAQLLEPNVNLGMPEIFIPLKHLTTTLEILGNIFFMRNEYVEAKDCLERACPLMELLPASLIENLNNSPLYAQNMPDIDLQDEDLFLEFQESYHAENQFLRDNGRDGNSAATMNSYAADCFALLRNVYLKLYGHNLTAIIPSSNKDNPPSTHHGTVKNSNGGKKKTKNKMEELEDEDFASDGGTTVPDFDHDDNDRKDLLVDEGGGLEADAVVADPPTTVPSLTDMASDQLTESIGFDMNDKIEELRMPFQHLRDELMMIHYGHHKSHDDDDDEQGSMASDDSDFDDYGTATDVPTPHTKGSHAGQQAKPSPANGKSTSTKYVPKSNTQNNHQQQQQSTKQKPSKADGKTSSQPPHSKVTKVIPLSSSTNEGNGDMDGNSKGNMVRGGIPSQQAAANLRNMLEGEYHEYLQSNPIQRVQYYGDGSKSSSFYEGEEDVYIDDSFVLGLASSATTVVASDLELMLRKFVSEDDIGRREILQFAKEYYETLDIKFPNMDEHEYRANMDLGEVYLEVMERVVREGTDFITEELEKWQDIGQSFLSSSSSSTSSKHPSSTVVDVRLEDGEDPVKFGVGIVWELDPDTGQKTQFAVELDGSYFDAFTLQERNRLLILSAFDILLNLKPTEHFDLSLGFSLGIMDNDRSRQKELEAEGMIHKPYDPDITYMEDFLEDYDMDMLDAETRESLLLIHLRDKQNGGKSSANKHTQRQGGHSKTSNDQQDIPASMFEEQIILPTNELTANMRSSVPTIRFENDWTFLLLIGFQIATLLVIYYAYNRRKLTLRQSRGRNQKKNATPETMQLWLFRMLTGLDWHSDINLVDLLTITFFLQRVGVLLYEIYSLLVFQVVQVQGFINTWREEAILSAATAATNAAASITAPTQNNGHRSTSTNNKKSSSNNIAKDSEKKSSKHQQQIAQQHDKATAVLTDAVKDNGNQKNFVTSLSSYFRQSLSSISSNNKVPPASDSNDHDDHNTPDDVGVNLHREGATAYPPYSADIEESDDEEEEEYSEADQEDASPVNTSDEAASIGGEDGAISGGFQENCKDSGDSFDSTGAGGNKPTVHVSDRMSGGQETNKVVSTVVGTAKPGMMGDESDAMERDDAASETDSQSSNKSPSTSTESIHATTSTTTTSTTASTHSTQHTHKVDGSQASTTTTAQVDKKKLKKEKSVGSTSKETAPLPVHSVDSVDMAAPLIRPEHSMAMAAEHTATASSVGLLPEQEDRSGWQEAKRKPPSHHKKALSSLPAVVSKRSTPVSTTTIASTATTATASTDSTKVSPSPPPLHDQREAGTSTGTGKLINSVMTSSSTTATITSRTTATTVTSTAPAPVVYKKSNPLMTMSMMDEYSAPVPPIPTTPSPSSQSIPAFTFDHTTTTTTPSTTTRTPATATATAAVSSAIPALIPKQQPRAHPAPPPSYKLAVTNAPTTNEISPTTTGTTTTTTGTSTSSVTGTTTGTTTGTGNVSMPSGPKTILTAPFTPVPVPNIAPTLSTSMATASLPASLPVTLLPAVSISGGDRSSSGHHHKSSTGMVIINPVKLDAELAATLPPVTTTTGSATSMMTGSQQPQQSQSVMHAQSSSIPLLSEQNSFESFGIVLQTPPQPALLQSTIGGGLHPRPTLPTTSTTTTSTTSSTTGTTSATGATGASSVSTHNMTMNSMNMSSSNMNMNSMSSNSMSSSHFLAPPGLLPHTNTHTMMNSSTSYPIAPSLSYLEPVHDLLGGHTSSMSMMPMTMTMNNTSGSGSYFLQHGSVALGNSMSTNSHGTGLSHSTGHGNGIGNGIGNNNGNGNGTGLGALTSPARPYTTNTTTTTSASSSSLRWPFTSDDELGLGDTTQSDFYLVSGVLDDILHSSSPYHLDFSSASAVSTSASTSSNPSYPHQGTIGVSALYGHHSTSTTGTTTGAAAPVYHPFSQEGTAGVSTSQLHHSLISDLSPHAPVFLPSVTGNTGKTRANSGDNTSSTASTTGASMQAPGLGQSIFFSNF